MIHFWDTSALLPLVLKEPMQEVSEEIWGKDQRHVAWNWLQVEAEAACHRQKVSPSQWDELHALFGDLGFLKLGDNDLPELLEFNRSAQLRSADAGHVFCFHRYLSISPDCVLVTYDKEMFLAAARMGVPVHPLCLDT